MAEQVIDREFGWDDEIVKDDDFILLAPGDYDFTVVGVERQRYEGNQTKADGLPPCPMAKVQLRIDAPQGHANIFNNIFLHSRTEGMISAFFASIGLKKKGEPLKMNWPAVPGSTGRAKIDIRKYNGNDYNEVKKFYPKDDSNIGSAPAPTSQPAVGEVTW
ncbi:MAG: DUF669 domain-containing protein [Clostridiales Family XIII bacterium]|jgi:hypothetical protein|nr:DUF669 domain-containing protein [Clostridiales Family XIII bacterium]